VDEVDVFFSESFYGKTYNPIALFTNKEIRDIIIYIFENGKKFNNDKPYSGFD
jgi:hypothetical protein